MVLQKLSIRKGIFSFPALRGSVFIALSLFFTSLYSVEYYEHDFRDINNTFHIRASLNPKSNKLQLNIFDQHWDIMPTHIQDNYAYGSIYFDAYYAYETLKLGVFAEKSASIYLNDGFVQTLFQSNNDFNTFLHNSSINTQLSKTDIDGYTNYYDIKGFYLQKLFLLNKYHTLSTKLKFFVSDDVQNVDINGYNTQDRFLANLEYYYRKKNYISHRTADETTAKGYGYSIDLEYIYNKEKLYIYAGLLNLGGIIYWDDISKMSYIFDSQTVYIGDDGYSHRKPFGIGRYEDHINYKQHLPMFYRASIDYAFYDYLSVGNNLSGYKDVVFNEPYITFRVYNSRYKVGYMYEANTAIFAAYFQHFKVEISNNFSFSQQVMQAKVHIWF